MLLSHYTLCSKFCTLYPSFVHYGIIFTFTLTPDKQTSSIICSTYSNRITVANKLFLIITAHIDVKETKAT